MVVKMKTKVSVLSLRMLSRSSHVERSDSLLKKTEGVDLREGSAVERERLCDVGGFGTVERFDARDIKDHQPQCRCLYVVNNIF